MYSVIIASGYNNTPFIQYVDSHRFPQIKLCFRQSVNYFQYPHSQGSLRTTFFSIAPSLIICNIHIISQQNSKKILTAN